MDDKWLSKVQKQFKAVSGLSNQVGYEGFKKALELKESFFAERLFCLFDKDRSESLSLSEWIVGLTVFYHGTNREKLRLLFNVYDVSECGHLDFSSLRAVIESCMKESRLTFSEDQVIELTLALLEEADENKKGHVTFGEFETALKNHPGVIENLSISTTNWIKPSAPQQEKSVGWCPDFACVKRSFINKLPVYATTFIYLALNIALFVHRIVQLKLLVPSCTGFDLIARGCGRCLNFNIALILFLMLRKTLTYIRSTRFSSALPIDKNIKFHKYVGIAILWFSLLHTFAHFGNFYTIVSYPSGTNGTATFTYAEYLFTTKPGIGWVAGLACLTGFGLLGVMLIMYIGALPQIRHNGHFEVFYWTHLFFIPFFVLCILHGPDVWKWLLAPAVIYIIERTLRFKWVISRRNGKTYVQEGILLPSKVTHLVINRPANFDYNPGDYVFINIPKIAQFEWHPFTISSAPELSDALWLHIRACGTWTNRLYNYFDERRKNWQQGTTKSFMKDQAKEIFSSLGIMNETTPGKKMSFQLGTAASPDDEECLVDSSSESSPSSNNSIIARTGVGNRSRLPSASSEMSDPGSKVGSIGMMTSPRSAMTFGSVSDKRLSAYDLMNMERSKSTFSVASSTSSSGADGDEGIDMSPKTKRSKSVYQHKNKADGDSDSFMLRRARSEKVRRRMSRWGTVSKGQNFAHMRTSPFIVNMDQEYHEEHVEDKLEVFVDGPYGAPAAHMFKAEHAIMIGAGIGITPFASILQSIMYRYQQSKQHCPSCSHQWQGDLPHTMNKLKKVDFFWINRDQKSFEWFVSLLSQLEIEQDQLGSSMDRFLDMNVYMTSALKKNDMKAVILQMALDLMHKKDCRDSITGLKTRTQAGRPDWDEVFSNINKDKKGKVTVFFCGAPALGNLIREKCEQYAFDFRKENF